MDMTNNCEKKKRVMHVCGHCGCTRLTSERFCDIHSHRYDNRPSAHRRGYNSRWRKERELFLAAHPFCAECLKNGIHTAATDVDHIVPHKGDKRLFWDKSNWQALCHSCHSRKTASEDMQPWCEGVSKKF